MGKDSQLHLAHLRGVLEAYMAKNGLRSTEQRRLIVQIFFDGPAHITIEQLLAQVRAADPRVGYATVYRTLKLLAECGVAHERRFGDGVTRYEVADEDQHHDHLICVECGAIAEFEEPAIERLQEEVAARYSFTVKSHKHELYGVCAACREQAARLASKRKNLALGLGGPHGLDKRPHPGAVLDARQALDPAGHVDAPGPGAPHQLAHVLWGQAAGDDDVAAEPGAGLGHERPVEGLALASEPLHPGVEHHALHRQRRRGRGQRAAALQPEHRDHLDAEAHVELRVLVAVKLHRAHQTQPDRAGDLVGRCPDKDPHG